MHAGATGTDVGTVLYVVALLILINLAVFVTLYRILDGKGRSARSQCRAASTTAESPPVESPVAKRLRR